MTELCEADDEGAQVINVKAGARGNFYERPKFNESGVRVDGKAKWRATQFNLLPVVLHDTGLPWEEASIYILSRLENSLHPSMSTFDGIADDLTAFRRFLDVEGIDWQDFPAHKLHRPTYRYSSHLRVTVMRGLIAASTARRRMSSIIVFYAWLKDEQLFIPAYAPWKESDLYFKVTGAFGHEFSKRVTTTDISIKVPTQRDPYAGTIDDEGKLRPLSLDEQQYLLQALFARGNTEMTIIHMFALLTGARIQTVLTFRVRHVLDLGSQLNDVFLGDLRCPVGQGTGIDTKNNKRMSLHLPAWFIKVLTTYARSDRSLARRLLASGGDTANQYLFLSKYGVPFYSGKEDSREFDQTTTRRHALKGQSVRKFMAEVIIPYVRSRSAVGFRYKFHDLRATFGMNLTDNQLKLAESGERTLHQVREYVKVRMGHDSAATTDLYLQYRGNASHVRQIADDHEEYLRSLAAKAGLI